MSESIQIQPIRVARGCIRPPGSKSITNRALICASLAYGQSQLMGVLDSDDTRVMVQSLQTLGVRIEHVRASTTMHVTGCRGVYPNSPADLFVGNSGTTIRFLTAAVATGHGQYRLDGIPRMRQRPIGDLLETLNQLGADARSENENGCPPVRLRAEGLRGGVCTVRGDISSQFLSAILMAAPCANSAVELHVEGTLVSIPYVTMTCEVMAAFGASTRIVGDSRKAPSSLFVPAPQTYQGRSYAVEPDASAASYFWAAAAITGGQVTVQGLGTDSLQGDVRFCDCLKKMGCDVRYSHDEITVTGGKLRGVDVDMNAISDTVQTLAAVALFAEGPTRITGVAHIRHKETDRIGDLACELRKVGAQVRELDDGLLIQPKSLRSATLATYEDHRMAMSLALIGLRVPGIRIEDPQCTAKTYPAFFEDLNSISG